MPTAPLANPVKDRLRAGKVALGINVRLSRSADIARIAKTTGHDFIFLDSQHAIFDIETLAHMCQTALAIGVSALVRVRSVNDPDVSLLLDAGASGIVFPDVNTPEEAARAVELVRFPPKGKRSSAGGYPHFDFRPVSVGDGNAILNEATLLACMIETPEGLDNVERIAAVDGIDVIHLGSNDLLANMGKAGQFDDPAIVEAQKRVIAAAKANGKFAGCGGNRDVTRQLAAIREGARFLTTQTDIAFLMAGAAQWTRGIRDGLGEELR
jgi:2-keto-3-deoxy-L-rhamnonate aldolase RhmA